MVNVRQLLFTLTQPLTPELDNNGTLRVVCITDLRTLHNCSPGDNSSKGCLEKQREQANKGVEAAVLIFL